jgi:hypothetical protein
MMSKHDTSLSNLYVTALEHGLAYASNRRWTAQTGRWFYVGDSAAPVPDTKGVKITHYDTDMIIIYPDRVVGLSHGRGSVSDRAGIDAILKGAGYANRFHDIFQRMPVTIVDSEPEDLEPVSRWHPPLRVEDVTGIG